MEELLGSVMRRLLLRTLSICGKLIHFRMLRRYTSIYDIDGWNIAIILDACRYDLFQETFDTSYLPAGVKVLDHRSILSAGTNSVHWMLNTFNVQRYASQITNTIYVNANPNAESTIDETKFHAVDSVWKYGWESIIGIKGDLKVGDSKVGTVLPRTVTDRTIHWFRRHPNKKIVVHYMQPHYPFVRKFLGFDSKLNVWQLLQQGRVNREVVWEAYKDNLDLVLTDLKLLIRCVGGRILVTSDHGNLIGEMGLYGHNVGWIPLNPLIKVPLLLLAADDPDSSYQPKAYETDMDLSEKAIEERLRALGYLG